MGIKVNMSKKPNPEYFKKYYEDKYKNNEQYKRDHTNKRLLRVYGVTLEQLEQMQVAQDNKCAICGNTFQKSPLPCIDHNHTTGKLRGLLCYDCNRGLGVFKDNIKICESAVAYLKKWTQ